MILVFGCQTTTFLENTAISECSLAGHHPTVFRKNEVSSPFVDLLQSEDILLATFYCRGDPRPPGVHVLPYMGFIGMCRSEGYGFQAVYSGMAYI